MEIILPVALFSAAIIIAAAIDSATKKIVAQLAVVPEPPLKEIPATDSHGEINSALGTYLGEAVRAFSLGGNIHHQTWFSASGTVVEYIKLWSTTGTVKVTGGGYATPLEVSGKAAIFIRKVNGVITSIEKV